MTSQEDSCAPSSSGSLPSWLAAATRHSTASPVATLIWCGIVAALCLLIGVRFLPLAASRSDLIDPSAEFHKRWIDYTEEFGGLSEIVVVISGDNASDVAQAAVATETELTACQDVVDVLGNVDWSLLEKRSLQYAAPDQLAQLHDLLDHSVLPAATGGAGLVPAAARLTSRLQSASAAGDPAGWAKAIHDTKAVVDMTAAVMNGEPAKPIWELPGLTEQFPQPNQFRDGLVRVVSCYPTHVEGLDGAARSVTAVRQILAEMKVSHPEVTFGLTGVPVLEFDEMSQSSRDMTLASVLSAVGVTLLLVVGFRGRRIPLIAVGTLAVAMAWSVGWAAVSVGSLNILSVSFAAILIGLGVDFSLHWLAHVSDAEAKAPSSRRPEDVAIEAASHCGTGIATAAVTTATAFLVASITPFRGLAELGIIAGGGVVLCALAALVVTPALVSLSRRQPGAGLTGTPRYARWLAEQTAASPYFFTMVSVCVVAVFGFAGFDVGDRMMPRVGYESNLLKMQPEGLPSVVAQKDLEESTDGGLLFGVSRTQSASEARELEQQFADLPEVRAVWSLGRMLPEDSKDRNELIQAIAQSLSVPVSERIAPSDRDDTLAALDELAVTVSLSQNDDAVELVDSLKELRTLLAEMSTEESRQLLDGIARAMAIQAVETVEALRFVAEPSPVSADLLPKPLRRRFLGSKGTWLVVAFPANPVWDEQPLADFVAALRSVDPEVTGTPIQNLEATRQIQSSYIDACGYALVAVILILFLDASTVSNLLLVIVGGTAISTFAYSSGLGVHWNNAGAGWAAAFLAGATTTAIVFDWRGTIRAGAAALPSIVGGVVTVGVLALVGIDFNPANLIVLPLILGIGVDDGVHILHAFRVSREKLPAATIHALTMTSLTSAVGFGSLILATHRGLASLGITLVVGVLACYCVSVFLLLPLCYSFDGARRGRAKVRRHPEVSAGGSPTRPVHEHSPTQSSRGEVVSR